MLSQLKIVNYAIIDEMNIQFYKGMTVITGETGAGKSIILGALGLTLGDRVDTSVLKNNQSKCVIEATFDLSEIPIKDFFIQHDIDFETHTILRREISVQGKSRAFVNDTPVALSVLKQLSEKLIDVHSQHQTLLLNKDKFQLNVIDSVAANHDLLEQYSKSYDQYKSLVKKFNQLVEDEQKLKNDLDYFQLQLKELTEVDLENINEQELIQQLDDLNNAEDIKSAAISISRAFEDDNGLLNILYSLQQQMDRAGGKNIRLQQLYERIKSIVIEAKDISEEAISIENDVILDEELAFKVSETVNQIKRLHQKYLTTETSQLIEIKNELEEKVAVAKSFDDELAKIQKEINGCKEELNMLAKKISESRAKVIPLITSKIEAFLKMLGMEGAKFEIKQLRLNDFSKEGVDKVDFYFSANKGMPANLIDKVASGGELSRLMLCIKRIMANSKKLPSIIFDEIDTGVSGEVAFKMGEMMQSIALSTQVFTITHLPQVASKGHEHYFVYKKELDNRTVTKIKHLTKEERIRATASMLSGSQVTDEAIRNAEKLLN